MFVRLCRYFASRPYWIALFISGLLLAWKVWAISPWLAVGAVLCSVAAVGTWLRRRWAVLMTSVGLLGIVGLVVAGGDQDFFTVANAVWITTCATFAAAWFVWFDQVEAARQPSGDHC